MSTLLSALVLFLATALPFHTTIATRYADTPQDEGGTPACATRVPAALYKAAHGERCAHRHYPCGTRLLITDGFRTATCTVLDRGPYGALDRNGVYFVAVTEAALRRRAGTYRGDLDLSPNVARALRMTAFVRKGKILYRRGRVPVLFMITDPIRIKLSRMPPLRS